ncbi:hypothetical protein A9Q81_07000 [Gammaproteobacteria bacterium 42_54_T18]|nr:hypothetical protein A9Q81_07000 [Gammaproteobacteria bacterium 42_54_T18]
MTGFRFWGLLIKIVGLSFILTGCGSENNSGDVNATGNVALINGKIYTVNDKQSVEEAVVVKKGSIVFVGSTAEAQSRIDVDTLVIDLKGKLVLPGIHDSHLHPLEAGSEAITCILDSSISPAKQATKLKACGEENTGLDWVLGWGYSLESLLAMKKDPRAFLDEMIPDRPVAIMEETSHSIWVNSKALALAGISANTPHPKGGAILKHMATGQPTGVLLDTAGEIIFDIAFAPNTVLEEMNYQGLLSGLEQVAKNGITSVVDARLYWKRNYLKAWDRAEKENTLTARAVLSLWAYPLEGDTDQIEILKSMYRDDGNSLLRVTQIKMYSDGIIHNSTASLIEPYKEYFEEVGPLGLNYFDKTRMTKYVTELEKAGFDMHIHAIGDRAVRESLDAIEDSMQVNGTLDSPRRHRLTHVEMVDSNDFGRFAELGVIADFQVAGEFTLPKNSSWVEGQIGDRHKDMLPVRTIYDTGALVTLSSDWDVSSLSPFVGMQNSLQRGEQSLPNIDAVIRAYTINAAILMRQEDKTGSIEVGKLGDLIVLDQDIVTVEIDSIAKTNVLLTLLEGKAVFSSPML